jgi:fructose-1,6-bisphosphatase/inositol monophosphatase family enzyme
MSDAVNLGPINGHSVGRILKEAVRRASTVIRAERLTFEAHTKASYAGTMDDVFTSADKAAQEIYLRTFSECFPGAGVLAEEDAHSVAPVAPVTAWFTVDPIDGTKAFVRRQSHGITTMVALVDLDANGQPEVISAYVGDINSDEVYGYRPGSERVHRITHLDTFETMGDDFEFPPIDDMHGLLRDPPDAYCAAGQKLIGRFSSYEIMGSSIGAWFARLWKGEVKALLAPPQFETPWDSTPVIGISLKLGFVFLKPEGDAWVAYQPTIPRNVFERTHDVLVVHGSYVKNGRLVER